MLTWIVQLNGVRWRTPFDVVDAYLASRFDAPRDPDRCMMAAAARQCPAQADLFDSPALSGFHQAEAIITPQEERALAASIDAAGLAPFKFGAFEGKRMTAGFGWRYEYDTARFEAAAPIPDWLLPLRERAARFARHEPAELVQALVTRYDPGAGIGWHRDRPGFEHVIGLSLGAPATMRFRRRRDDGRFERATAPLEPRGIYHMSGEARHRWEHSIAEMPATRWSITFRSLAPGGLPRRR